MFGCCAAYGRRTGRKLAYAAGRLQNTESVEAPILSSGSAPESVPTYESMPNQLSGALDPEEPGGVSVEPIELTAEQQAEEEAYRKLIASYGS